MQVKTPIQINFLLFFVFFNLSGSSIKTTNNNNHFYYSFFRLSLSFEFNFINLEFTPLLLLFVLQGY